MDALLFFGIIGLVVWFLYQYNQKQKRLEGDDSTPSLERPKQRGGKISIVIDDVIDDWMEFIVGAHGRADDFFNLVIDHLEEVAVPEITWGFTNVFSAKPLKRGKHRVGAEYLTGDEKKQNQRMLCVRGGSVEILIGARNYGDNLAVRRLIWKSLYGQYGLTFRTIYAREEMSLFTGVVHRAVLNAVKDLMVELEQDPSKIESDIKEVLKAW